MRWCIWGYFWCSESVEGAGVHSDSDGLCSPTGCGRLQTLRRWHMLLLWASLIGFKCQMLTINLKSEFYQRWAPNIFVAVLQHQGMIIINHLFDLCWPYFNSEDSRDVWSHISAIDQKFPIFLDFNIYSILELLFFFLMKRLTTFDLNIVSMP